MNATFQVFSGAGDAHTNGVAAARTAVAQWAEPFDTFSDRFEAIFSFTAASAATPGGAPVVEAWAANTSLDVSGTGILLGRVTLPQTVIGAETPFTGIMIAANPTGTKYVVFTVRAGLAVDGVTPVALTYRAMLLALEGPDGDFCNVATAPLIRLRNSAKVLADKEDDASVTDDTWDDWVNQGVDRLWELVANAFSDHFYKTAPFTLTGGEGDGKNAYDTTVLGDFRRVRLLEWSPGTAARRKIRAFNFNEKDARVGAFSSIAWCNVRRYRLMGTRVMVEPFEQAAGTYRLYYIPAPTKLVANCDAIDAQLDPWSEFASLYAAMKALGKEESDDGTIQRQMAVIRDAIVESAPSRNDGDADVISDVEGDGGGGYFG